MRVKVINKQPASVLQKKRVCTYARVSTVTFSEWQEALLLYQQSRFRLRN